MTIETLRLTYDLDVKLLKGDSPPQKKKKRERTDKKGKIKTRKQTATATRTKQHLYKTLQTPSLSNPIIVQGTHPITNHVIIVTLTSKKKKNIVIIIIYMYIHCNHVELLPI